MLRAGRLALVAPLALALIGARPASGDEGESALSVGLGFATFTIPDHGGAGAALGGEYERGLSDAFWLRASAAGSIYRGSDGEGAIAAGQGIVGLTYVVDVLKYVPYVHLGAGAVAIGGEGVDAEVHPVGEIGVGLDILSRRGLSYGPFARLQSFLDDSAFVSVGVRITWRWGFF
ncbi:MAG TPA: hypothetical protein VK698_07560 [Kofleriaceae bacterium]|nr:hypothetical protein [Kofleriaceae bacterium]